MACGGGEGRVDSVAASFVFTSLVVGNDTSTSPRGGIVTRGRVVYMPRPALSRVLFLEFCSTISAHLHVFLISQVQEGKDGRSDTLLVSQFGLTRGGAVSRLDLDPLPRLPRLFGAEGVAGGGARAGGLLVHGTQPRLTGTWTSPLVWPNEVNEVCPGCTLLVYILPTSIVYILPPCGCAVGFAGIVVRSPSALR